MAKRFFKGKLDLDGLSISDLAKASQALAALEELAGRGVIEFAVGTSRESSVPRKEPAPRMVPQRRKVADLMRGRDWMPVKEISELSGIGPNSISPTLSGLLQMGVLERKEIERPGTKLRNKPMYAYRLKQ